MSCGNERCDKCGGGCGCERCGNYEYSCRAVNGPSGRVFYYNDGCKPTNTYKAFYGKAYNNNNNNNNFDSFGVGEE